MWLLFVFIGMVDEGYVRGDIFVKVFKYIFVNVEIVSVVEGGYSFD